MEPHRHGWPDVIFSEQANDPVWMAQKPFDFAMNLKGVFPANLLKGWPAPSLGAVHRQRAAGLPPGQPGPGSALRQQEADEPVRLHGPEDVAAVGGDRHRRSPRSTPGYIIGNIGDSYGAWLYLWADKCPISQVVGTNTVKINASDVHCTRMASLLDPLIKSGVVSTESVFTADFATKYGGANDKILLMPGPVWYAKDIFSGTLDIPAGEMTAALPLRWNSEPLVTGQVGGGPWIISKHTKNQAAADRLREVGRRRRRWSRRRSTPLRRVTRRTARPRTSGCKSLNADPYFAAPGPGDQGGRAI